MQGKPKGGAIRRFVHKLRVDAHAVWIAARDRRTPLALRLFGALIAAYALSPIDLIPDFVPVLGFVDDLRSEEHTSELQSLMRISYAVFCLNKKKTKDTT